MLLWLMCAGCRDGERNPPQQGGAKTAAENAAAGRTADLSPQTAARVGGLDVTLSDLRGEAADSKYDAYKAGSPEMSALRALDKLITDRLLYQEAAEKKAYENSPIERELRVTQEVWLASLYVNEVLRRQVKVSEEEMKPFLPDKWDSVEISMLVADDEAAARKAVSAVREGKSTFEEEAKKGAGTIAPKKGRVGWILRNTAFFTDKRHVDRIFSLKPGEMTDPFLGPLGWTVVRVDNRRGLSKLEIEEIKNTSREGLYNRKFDELLNRDAALHKWTQYADNTVAKSPGAVVLEGLGRVYTKADFDTFVKIHLQSGHLIQQPETPREILRNFARHMSWAEEAGRAGHDRRTEFIERMRSFRIARTAQAVEAKIKESVKPDKDELLAYYKKNKNRFREEDSLWLLILSAGGQSQAREFRKRAEAGEDFKSLIRQAGSDAPDARGAEEVGPLTRKMFPPDLAAILFSLREGDVSQVIPLAGQYIVAKCTRFKGGKTKSFEAVRKEVLNAYRNDNYMPLLEKKVAELKARYPVRMNEKAVEIVANEIREEAAKRGGKPKYH
ncbi:MAG: peptidyl-prolyl cis-trans isomerase [Deltaproteobacteria bacterium]|nr:peptidyl-prolyl cis-trans isomerase [Deltaproteobacteria bacterium]